MTDNMKIWDKVKRPPPEALKKIFGGRLKGMTDIKPQWRYQAMTELFGPCGIGWRYSIINLWIEDGANELKVANAKIELFIKDGGEWSHAIPGVGGSMLVAKENAGPYTTDESYKMAVTDALSTAMKVIGVAADIYMGGWDGNKYTNDPVVIGEISGEPVDMVKVNKAATWVKKVIEKDDLEQGSVLIQEKWKLLTNDEKMQAGVLLKDKAPGSKKMYGTLLTEYLNFTPTEGV